MDTSRCSSSSSSIRRSSSSSVIAVAVVRAVAVEEVVAEVKSGVVNGHDWFMLFPVNNLPRHGQSQKYKEQYSTVNKSIVLLLLCSCSLLE